MTLGKANNPDVHWDLPAENSKKKHKGRQMETSNRNEENNDDQQSSVEVSLSQLSIERPLRDKTAPGQPPLLELSVGKEFTPPPQASSSPEVVSCRINATSSTPPALLCQIQGLQRERPSMPSSGKVSSPRQEPPAKGPVLIWADRLVFPSDPVPCQ
jgi:hypothetical protein